MGRSNIDFKDWMRLDIKPVEERNTRVDIKLIFMTVGVLFGDAGARLCVGKYLVIMIMRFKIGDKNEDFVS